MLNAGTWDCSGTINRVRLDQSFSSFFGNNGITIGAGNVRIHILSGALVTNASGTATSDAISDNVAGATASTLEIVNDGTVQANSLGGANFGADLALNSTLGSVTIVNNGSWTGVQAGMSIRAQGVTVITNNAGGVISGSITGIDVTSGLGATITNWGTIASTAPTVAGNRAIAGAAQADSIYLMAGSIVGDILTAGGGDLVEWRGGSLAGKVRMDTGSDTMLVASSNFNGTQLLDGGDDVATADGWIDRLTFQGITASTPGGNIVNWESITLDAAALTISDGALTTGSGAGMGLFLTNGSVLDGLNAFALTGNMTIDGSSSFIATGAGAGIYSVSGNLANAGTITMQDHVAGDALSVGGNYVSNGGKLLIDTVLGADASITDALVIRGNSTLGTGATALFVANTTGGGALTTGDGIRVVRVDGSSAAGAFALGSRVAAGAYEYNLFYNGVGANAANGDWYLRSTVIPETVKPNAPPTGTTNPSNPSSPAADEPAQLPNYRVEVPVYMAMPAMASRFGLAVLGTYHDRVGEDYMESARAPAPGGRNQLLADAAAGEGGRKTAAWIRLFGETGDVGSLGKNAFSQLNGFHRNGPSYDFGLAGFQIGVDFYRELHANGSGTVAGIYAGAGRVESTVDAVYGGRAGTGRLDGYSLGAYLTHKGASGWYVDAVLQGTRYGDGKARSIYGERLSTEGWGLAASLEAGYPIALGRGWAIEPQAQLIYQHISLDGGADNFGRVSYDASDALHGRLGARLTKTWTTESGQNFTTWARTNVWHSFGAQATTTFASLSGLNPVALKTDLGGSWGQLGLGISGRLTANVSAFAAGDYNFSLEKAGGYSLSGRAGVRVVW